MKIDKLRSLIGLGSKTKEDESPKISPEHQKANEELSLAKERIKELEQGIATFIEESDSSKVDSTTSEEVDYSAKEESKEKKEEK